MTSFYVRPDGSGLDELYVGATVVINGSERVISVMQIEPVTEDDPELGIQAGDLVTTLTFADSPSDSQSNGRDEEPNRAYEG